jgi:hypothetical protein
MQEHELPTRNGIVDHALDELDGARNGLAEAASQQTDDEVPSEAELADWLSSCLN